MVEIYNQSFQNWKEFINWSFSIDGNIIKVSECQKNDTYIENYKYKKNELTEIKVGYLNNFTKLINFDIYSSETPALNRYFKNDLQYFEQGMFDNPAYFGGPGLNFNKSNISAFAEEFLCGLYGKEIHYFKNGELEKVQIVFDEHRFPLLYYVGKKPLLIRLIRKILGLDNLSDYEKVEINLHDIFGGI
jgi:hypothetical protein